jgi:hypothetical protein
MRSLLSLAKPQELPHLLTMADDLEIPDSGKVDNKLLLSTLRDLRREQRETRDLLVSLTKHVIEMDKRFNTRLDDAEKRLSARIDDLRDEVELIMKAEIMGRLANFETRIDQKIEELLAQ